MRHALWIVVLVAACGRDGSSSDQSEPQRATLLEKQSALALTRDTRGLQVTSSAKGKQVRLGGTFQSAVMVRRAADGTLQTECFDDAAAAESFLQATPPTAKATAEVQ
jgi:hypothetical protein